MPTADPLNSFAASLAHVLPATPPRGHHSPLTYVPGTPRSERISNAASPFSPDDDDDDDDDNFSDCSPFTRSTPDTSLRISRVARFSLSPCPSPSKGLAGSPRIAKSLSSALARLSPTMAQKKASKPAPRSAGPTKLKTSEAYGGDDDEDEDVRMDEVGRQKGAVPLKGQKLFMELINHLPVPPATRLDKPRKSLPARMEDDIDSWLPPAGSTRGLARLSFNRAERPSLAADNGPRGVKRKR
ncbi:hypothetical protein AURDEDRAFT_112740 [Auricularia subglabra TFB-10046 SS5]|nr:hypothetical protein AURDEDRAFT_112740 [Auricularia subglabra TFB-10046 SS5]